MERWTIPADKGRTLEPSTPRSELTLRLRRLSAISLCCALVNTRNPLCNVHSNELLAYDNQDLPYTLEVSIVRFCLWKDLQGAGAEGKHPDIKEVNLRLDIFGLYLSTWPIVLVDFTSGLESDPCAKDLNRGCM